MDPTRRGKVARLPLGIREELNRRLLENEPARKICAWLNQLPETISVCDEFGEQPIDDRNISDWRKGGFQDWLRRRNSIEQTRELAQWSIKLAKASGGNITEGAAAILSGQILEVLEGFAKIKEELGAGDKEKTVEQLSAIAEAVDQVSLALRRVRSGDHDRVKLDQNQQRLAQTDEALKLEREKYQRETAGLALKLLNDDRAKQIESGAGTNEDKIEIMGKHLFGELWKARTGK